jgi:two-component system, cell cycle sensor histidine kinase and response regulator CckA
MEQKQGRDKNFRKNRKNFRNPCREKGCFCDLGIEGLFRAFPVRQYGQGGVMACNQDVMWLTSADGNEMLYISPAYEKVWGRTCRSLYDEPMSWLDAVHPDESGGVLARAESARRGEIASQQYRIIRPDGSVRLISNSYFLIKEISGNVCNLVSVAQDITERHRLEQLYFQGQKLEALGRLAGGVAHDFNNQLTVIVGYCDMLTSKLDPADPLRGAVEQIRRAGERATCIARRLQAFSRKQVLMPVAVNLNVLITEMEPRLRRLIGEGIAFRFVPGPNLWKVNVDRLQTEQAITNLVINAGEAMEQRGTLTIETSNVKPEEAPGEFVMLTVADTGRGMTEAIRERLFEPFFTTKGPDKEAGLGLATVYGIVKQSGGHIDVASAPGAGTTFKAYWPRGKTEVAAAVSSLPSRRGESGMGAGGSTSTLRRGTETVLLVENDGEIRTMARTVLQSLGYVVVEAKSGPEALTHCHKHKGTIHVMVTEGVLANMTGRHLASLAAQIRKEIKVLYLSREAEEVKVLQDAGEPATAVLLKPFTAAELARKVREVLDLAPARSVARG